MHSTNPATGELLARYTPHDASEIERRLARAAAAFVAWRERSFAERSALLLRVAERLRGAKEDAARLMTQEMGKPIGEARAEVDKCAWVCEYYAEHAAAMLAAEPVVTDAKESCVRFDPLGPVLAIMPWNFPFWQVFRFLAPTLMAGNVGLLKHAENTQGCALLIEEMLREAGAPEGVFTSLVVERQAVAEIIRDRRIAAVSLTGSVRAGRAVAQVAGEMLKPCVLELGGSDPFIVLADADFDLAIDGAVIGRMINGGQSCIAAKRFIVEAPLYERFATRLAERIGELRVGDPFLADTRVGPLARPDLRDELHRQVEESVARGARLLLGGHAIGERGAFYAPTVLGEVKPGMSAFDEETFGPLAAVVRAEDVDDAVSLANLSQYGLGASVWTKSERGKALASRIESGHVAVNGIVKSDPRLPFGGIKDSGFGRELGRYGILAFVNIKAVWVG